MVSPPRSNKAHRRPTGRQVAIPTGNRGSTRRRVDMVSRHRNPMVNPPHKAGMVNHRATATASPRANRVAVSIHPRAVVMVSPPRRAAATGNHRKVARRRPLLTRHRATATGNRRKTSKDIVVATVGRPRRASGLASPPVPPQVGRNPAYDGDLPPRLRVVRGVRRGARQGEY